MRCEAALGLGSNVGDRVAHLAAAVRALRTLPGVTVRALSPLYRTSPVGVGRQPAFANAVAGIRTTLGPGALVRALLGAERALGRRRGRSGAPRPRTVDLDLLVMGRGVSTDRRALVPHPRLHERAFALRPLLDVAPRGRHPVLHRSFRALLARVPAGQRVARYPAAVQRRFRRLAGA